MATVFTRIKRKVRDGDFVAEGHVLDELEAEGFGLADAVKAILNATEFDKLTHDETHVRYVFYGYARDGRSLTVATLMSQGIVILKTAYEG